MRQGNVFFGELTRKEFNDDVAVGTIEAAIVPTGATEQHQDHLAMIHDTVSVTEIARRVAMRFWPRVIVAPTIPMSVSEHHMARGGALTVRAEIHLETVHDVCDSLVRLGVKKVMVVNGHGGNKRAHMENKAPDALARLDAMGVRYVTYWETVSQAWYEANLELERSAGHAGEFETSFAMALFPERIRDGEVNYENAQKATTAKGGAILEAVVDGVAGEMASLL
jgi:creatinine amidohydrolase